MKEEDKFVCEFTGNPWKPPIENRRIPPRTITEKINKMDDCCKASLATLSLTRKIAKNAGAIRDPKETYPSGVKAIKTSEDYGFPMQVPKKWLVYNARENEKITIYNHKQLNIVLLSKLAEMDRVLGVGRILSDKFPVPNKLLIPGATGNEITNDYTEIFSQLFTAIDKSTFNSPIAINVQDIDLTEAGDQSLNATAESLPTALEAMWQLMYETHAVAKANLEVSGRAGHMLGRLYRTVGRLWYATIAIIDGLGIPVRQKWIKIPIEFRLGLTKKQEKGFKPVKDEEPKIPDFDETSETFISNLCENSEIQTKVYTFQENQLDIRDWLIKLIQKK